MLQIFDVFGHEWILQTKSEIANSEGEIHSLAAGHFLYAASRWDECKLLAAVNG